MNKTILKLGASLIFLMVFPLAHSYDCSALPAYVGGSGYQSGDNVVNAGEAFRCKVGGWCSQGGPYEPGVGWAWSYAWDGLGSCDSGGGSGGSSSGSSGSSGSGSSSGNTSSGGDADCGGLPHWDIGAVYTGGSAVQYQGVKYVANWWTQGENPAQNSGPYQVWSNSGACGTGSSSGSSSSGSSSGGDTAVGRNGQLHVCGTRLCNKDSEPVQLRGMSTHGLQWYGWGDCVTDASLDALADDWRADILRVSLYVQEGGYETDPAGYTAQVSHIIDEVTERGMYVLVDWHQLDPGDPNYNLENARRFFTDIAREHADQNNIIYDVANEPNNVSWNDIRSYAMQIIPVIRQYDPDAVVVVGTHGWASLGVSDGRSAQDIIDNPVTIDNIMYGFHFYAASHGQYYRDTLKSALDRGLPIFVTEWGSQTYTGDGGNDFASAQAYLDLLDQYQVSWTNWNYSDDHRSGAVWQTGTCSSGPWTAERLKEAGRWVRDKIRNR
ncbi:cellulase family glycosylhydrolase [Microbulbifer thermotolerans]|uniref:cellulase family glycosylhydrolase n=1 Tax=Microbulbifer thermotolerans TaxID=252514 RepID=UPI00224B0F56|nr:cellulase family glycosylhydrolase [Microbulbifer thermotolerans]MCX2781954.1 cellulase family glycosylhydrolase [Microbulbifer thermotolerans]MCX2841097.1 cellulase family glycosylhydrolase [Microbulbifer thermotolerans]